MFDMSMLDDIGGEASLRDLFEYFYDLVETLPEGSNLRRLHARGHGVDHARVEQFNFLSGFMGGRQHYKEKHGHMDVKLMHAHVPIREKDADKWVLCMSRALNDEGHEDTLADRLTTVFRRIADILVNDVKDWETAGTRRYPGIISSTKQAQHQNHRATPHRPSQDAHDWLAHVLHRLDETQIDRIAAFVMARLADETLPRLRSPHRFRLRNDGARDSANAVAERPKNHASSLI